MAVFCDSYAVTKSKHCPQVASTSLRRKKRVGETSGYEGIARDPLPAVAAYPKAVAPSKFTYILRASPLDASIWGA